MSEQIQCSIGVMAYNEERNIGNLLRALRSQRLDTVSIAEIVVVSSGCTDNTECVVREEMDCDPCIRLLVQEKREGKMSAINLFLHNAQHEVVVIINADVLPEETCIERLVAPFADPVVGMTGGRPVAINSKDTLPGFAATSCGKCTIRSRSPSPRWVSWSPTGISRTSRSLPTRWTTRGSSKNWWNVSVCARCTCPTRSSTCAGRRR